jgi:hypothetical protein
VDLHHNKLASLGNYTFVVCDCTAKGLVSWVNSCKAILLVMMTKFITVIYFDLLEL